MQATVKYNENGNPEQVETEHVGQTVTFDIDGSTAVAVAMTADGGGKVYAAEVGEAIKYVESLPFVQATRLKERV